MHTRSAICYLGRSAHALNGIAEKWLIGSPELVIEVKSPSNSKQELYDNADGQFVRHGAVAKASHRPAAAMRMQMRFMGAAP